MFQLILANYIPLNKQIFHICQAPKSTIYFKAQLQTKLGNLIK